jgi:hypothetical protein
MRTVGLYIFLFWSLVITAQEPNEIMRIDSALQKSFQAKAETHYKTYQHDSAAAHIPGNTVLAAKFIYIYYDNKDSVRLLKKDLKNKLPLKSIIKKYHLSEDDGYMMAYAMDVLFLQPHYNKICFTSHLRLNRNDLVMDNTPGIKTRSQIDSGMYFINQKDDSEIEIMYFYEKYKPHAMPAYLNDALHFYHIFTQSKTPIYTMAYRLDIKPRNTDGQLLDSLWRKYPGMPVRPQSPISYSDSAIVKKYHKAVKVYDDSLSTWAKNKSTHFYKLVKTDSTVKPAFDRYAGFIKNYPVFEYGQLTSELYAYFGITNRLTSYYARHTSAAYYRVHDLYMDSAIKSNNYSLFAKTFYYTYVRRMNKESQNKLIELKQHFFKDLNKFYVGQMANILLKAPNLTMRQALGTSYCYNEATLNNELKQIQTYLQSGSKDELMNYYMCMLYEIMIDDVSGNTDKEEEWFEKYLHSNPVVEGWLDY